MAVAIRADKLLKDLDELWVSLGKEQGESGAVIRACAMTLIVLVDREVEAADPGETIAELMHDHPARAIVIRVGGTGELEAHATAQCWMPFGRRQQICCEQIEISAPGALLSDVPAVLRGLLVPDLPVVLWLRDASLIKKTNLQPFFDIVNKVIVDRRGLSDSAWLTTKIRDIAATGKPVADLSWASITRWRESIARLFDDPARRRKASTVGEIVIQHSPPEPRPAALYLGAWLRLALGRHVPIRFEKAQGVPWTIASVALRGGGCAVTVARKEDEAVEVTADGQPFRAVFHQLRESDLLREELSMPERDPIFENVLKSL